MPTLRRLPVSKGLAEPACHFGRERIDAPALCRINIRQSGCSQRRYLYWSSCCRGKAILNAFAKKLAAAAELGPEELSAIRVATSWPRHYAARKDIIREGDAPGPSS